MYGSPVAGSTLRCSVILMNDPTYIEASRKLAERMIKEAPAAAQEKIAFAFRLATALCRRRPS